MFDRWHRSWSIAEGPGHCSVALKRARLKGRGCKLFLLQDRRRCEVAAFCCKVAAGGPRACVSPRLASSLLCSAARSPRLASPRLALFCAAAPTVQSALPHRTDCMHGSSGAQPQGRPACVAPSRLVVSRRVWQRRLCNADCARGSGGAQLEGPAAEFKASALASPRLASPRLASPRRVYAPIVPR
jgi:hypothetical protein